MSFKNDTEEEFTQILNLYNIEWLYEPTTFPVEWDDEGNVTMAISPDFYLPHFQLYLELTTMEQKYVTKKNKKMKRVRELYPGNEYQDCLQEGFPGTCRAAEAFRRLVLYKEQVWTIFRELWEH